MSFWDRVDKVFTRVEKKGFNVANKAHIWAINIMLTGMAYGVYSIFRDYNEFFLAGRNPNYGIDPEEGDFDLKEADINELIERKRESLGR